MKLSRVAERYYARCREILETMEQAMQAAPEAQSVSHRLILQMLPHHEAAVEMARELLQYTTCLPLQELADRIVVGQTRGIETMHDALPDCGRPLNTEAELTRYAAREGCIRQTMLARMHAVCPEPSINVGFLRRMHAVCPEPSINVGFLRRMHAV